jgi:hypothetical protein
MEGQLVVGTPDAGGPSARLVVHVLATTAEGTRCALMSAKRLTDGLDARVVLLAPRVTSFAAAFDPSSDERAAIVAEHRSLAARVGIEVTVLFCVCQRLDDVVHEMLGRSSLVIVGGRRRTWCPGHERLVRRLTSEGYPVVFAQIGADQAPARVHAMAS